MHLDPHLDPHSPVNNSNANWCYVMTINNKQYALLGKLKKK